MCVVFLSGFSLGLSNAAFAVNEMLVYNSGEAGSSTPGRYLPDVAPQTPTDATYLADDHQCAQSEGDAILAPMHLYVGLANGSSSSAPTDACGGSSIGDGVCGYDITVTVENSVFEGDPRFRIPSSGFTPAVGSYSQSHNVAADGLTLQVNGVNISAVPGLPIHVGEIMLERIAEPTPGTTCATACETSLCATVRVTKAHIVKEDLSMESLSDSFDLLRLPEPDADVLLWGGALLLAALERRRRSSLPLQAR